MLMLDDVEEGCRETGKGGGEEVTLLAGGSVVWPSRRVNDRFQVVET